MTPEERLTGWISRWGGDVMRLCRSQLRDAQLAEDARVATILTLCGLCKSRNEARQQIASGAVLLITNL